VRSAWASRTSPARSARFSSGRRCSRVTFCLNAALRTSDQARARWKEVRASAQDDLVALGDDIRALDVDIQMPGVTADANSVTGRRSRPISGPVGSLTAPSAPRIWRPSVKRWRRDALRWRAQRRSWRGAPSRSDGPRASSIPGTGHPQRMEPLASVGHPPRRRGRGTGGVRRHHGKQCARLAEQCRRRGRRPLCADLAREIAPVLVGQALVPRRTEARKPALRTLRPRARRGEIALRVRQPRQPYARLGHDGTRGCRHRQAMRTRE
jgi:hypothetical protein